MKISDFKKQSTSPEVYASDFIGVFADSNGNLIQKTYAGVESLIGAKVSGVLTSPVLPTGGAPGIATGLYIGATGSQSRTGLASPSVWIPFSYNGVTVAVPGYYVS